MRPAIHRETIELIVADYDLAAERREAEEAWWRGDDQTFSSVIVRATRSMLPNGKRHAHQRRLNRSTLELCVSALLRLEKRLATAPDFHGLWIVVADAIKPIRGAGELLAYDVADRLRHRLGLSSRHLVYLHAGTRVGARRLVGGRLDKDDAWAIARHKLPNELEVLNSHEVEDVLCSYKDELLLSPSQLQDRWAQRRLRRCSPDDGPGPRC